MGCDHPGGDSDSASLLALADHLTSIGSNQSLTPDIYSRSLLVVSALGVISGLIAITAGIVAWIGAIMNARRLEDKRWFNLMLWVGITGLVTTPLFGLGVFVSLALMLAYFIGAPDATGQARLWMITKRQMTTWTIWGWVAIFASGFLSMLFSNLTNPWGFLHGQTWLALTLIFASVSVGGVGIIAVSAAYWGEVFNARRLADRSWFKVLLWVGIVATITMPLFGLGAIIGGIVGITYLVAGPDGTAVQPPAATTSTRLPPRHAATS